MKQHITEQLLEINKEQSDRLLGWLSNKGYYDTGEVNMTIGQMIEFIKDNAQFDKVFWSTLRHEWVVRFQIGEFEFEDWDSTELTYPLWEGVKTILNFD